MKTFISYSLSQKDESILPFLSFMLKDDNILSSLSQNIESGEVDLNTKNAINESNIFIGIMLVEGSAYKRVFNEWSYANSKKIPSIILIEETLSVDLFINSDYLSFNRSKIQLSIYEIERRMKPPIDDTEDADKGLPWIICGNAIIKTLYSVLNVNDQGASNYVISGRLNLIEQRLLSLDSAAFQNLCDVYLSCSEKDFTSINRTGSQLGKQKTVKGTPDTFFRLEDGSLRCVEYTTQTNNLISKIKSDIDSCLNPEKTGIPATEVRKIIIFFNSRIDIAEETDITQYAESKKIRIELIGLDWLALEIYSKYLILAKDILGIPLDTGQLLPLKNFIDEYNNKANKLSTPLDNSFLNRKSELSEIENILQKDDLLIISGFPGVGKTKIALESIYKFLDTNSDFSAFAVSNKDQDISEDLKIHLQQDSNFILFVDDANRQLLNFKQILGIFKEIRKGKIKLVITVRDYALNDILNECLEYKHQIIELNKFTDDEIKELISSDSFQIKNSKYQQKIIELADGNARLAIMAARLAKQRQELFLLNDVAELFDTYFQTFIKDFDIFNNKVLVKALGIISFFFSIDRKNKELIQAIVDNFEINYHEFNEAIDELEKKELVEIKFNVARVSEQTMATYFFYKVFINDEILNFKTLLFKFYSPPWLRRFKDTIIPSNNLFFYTKPEILKKLNFWLDEYYETIKNSDEKILEFFDLFWIYKREELLKYFYDKVKIIPEPVNPVYSTKYEMNDYAWPHDKSLNFITNLFNHYTESFLPAIDLAFEYCRKTPDALPELIRRIRENMLFDETDEHTGFIRQVEFFNHIISKSKDQKVHYLEAFFALSRTFLSHYYQINKSGRKNTVSFYQYPLPFYDVTKDFRKNVWLTLFELYDLYPQKIFDVIKSFNPGFMESIIKILEFDISLLIPFIENKLNPNDFAHIYFVHDFANSLDRFGLKDRSYRNLKSKFFSQEFDYFKKLDWSFVKGKQDFEFTDHQDFDKLKEQDLRNSFIFKDKEEFDVFNNAITLGLLVEPNLEWTIVRSLDIIIEENFLHNNELGFLLLENVLTNYPRGLQDLYRSIKIIINKSTAWAYKLWQFLESWNNAYKIFWQLSFFGYLPESNVTNFYKDELLSTINSINQPCTLFFESFKKFEALEKHILHKILTIAVEKIESLHLRITYSYHFFEKFTDYFSNNFELISEAYVQQVKFDAHFDYDNKGLEKLIILKPAFLIEYIKLFYTDTNRLNRNTEKYVPFIWDMENHVSLIEEAADIIIEHNPCFGLGDYSLNILFNRLSDIQIQKAKNFILYYISKNKNDRCKINAIFEIIRKFFSGFFEEAFIKYLTLNTDIESFKMISWIGNGGIYHGGVIFGEIHAKKWQTMYDMLAKCENQLEIIPIRTYIKQQIDSEMKSAEWEKRRKFSDPNYQE